MLNVPYQDICVFQYLIHVQFDNLYCCPATIMAELLRQNLVFICWLASLLVKKFCVPSVKLFPGSSPVLDYAAILINICTQELDIPVINFIKSLLENRDHFVWFFMSLYIIGLGIIAYESTDLDDFCAKLLLKSALICGQRALAEKIVARDKAMKSGKIRLCWHCLEEEKPQLKCGGCRKARYCGEECQKEDWGRHGDWCRRRGLRKKKQRMERGKVGEDDINEVD